MRAPVSWLRELADVPADATGADIAASLVRVGARGGGAARRRHLRAPGRRPGARGDAGEAEERQDHQLVPGRRRPERPDAHRGHPQGIVCGAHNFKPGDHVVCILPGGVLPGPFEISARKTYGHVSNGMICSAMELGLGEDHSGIIVLEEWLGDNPDVVAGLKPGQDAIELLGLADEVVEVNVTPDRGYCFSLRGIAREYALADRRRLPRPGRPCRRRGPRGQRQRVCRPPRRRCARRGPPGLRPLHRAGGAWRQRPRGDAVVDAEAAHPGRDASHLARRRHHQLRDDAARPAAARLRPRHPLRDPSGSAGPGRGSRSRPSTTSSGRSTPRTCSSSTAVTPRWPSRA